MRTEKLEYLDGLKGIGCVAVFLTHFVYAFYYGMYHYDPVSCHLPGKIDIVIGKSPLNVFFNGNTAVRLFLILSGFLLCRSFLITGDKKRLAASAKKRYLRLMPTVLVINILIYLAMKFGLYQNTAAAVLAGSEEWFAGFNSFSPSFLSMLKESLYGCFLFGTNDYNGVLWTLQILFLGAYIDYALAALTGGRRFRWIVYAIVAVVLLRTDFLGIFLGYVLCDFMCTDWNGKQWLCGNRILNWLMFAVGLYFMCYPSAGFGYEGTLWGILPFVFVNYYHIFGVLCFVFAVLNLKSVQGFLSKKIFLYMGRISYSLYLIHFLVIATFGSWFLLTVEPLLGYNLTCLIDLVLISVITVGLSELSVRYVEPLSGKLTALLDKQ